MRKRQIAILLTAFICFLCSSLRSEEISDQTKPRQLTMPSFQIRFERLYLPQGTESLIFSGCPVKLVCGSDTLLHTWVEQSFEGVSWTRKIPEFDSLIKPDDCLALVVQATIDTVSPLTIGTDIPSGSPLDNLINNDSGGIVRRLVSYDSRTAMLIDYEQGVINGYLSYRSAHNGTTNNNVTIKNAPYIAVLAPHPARAFNQEGVTTTSLYYRFDPSNIPSYFDGDNVSATTSFFDLDEKGRPFEFDSKKGERLFRTQRKRPRTLKIYVQDKSLQRLRSYYADILSRDRCRVKIVDNRKDADISFLWWLKSGPFYLSEDTTGGRRINESIRLFHNLLSATADESNHERRAFLLEKADRVLSNDIGYFALFRPAIFLTTSSLIVGNPFGDEGQISLAKLSRIILPVDSESEQ